MEHSVTRRSLLSGALAATQLSLTAAPAQAEKPNVLVILFDDLGVHDQGYLGATDLKTPHIDRLAASGTVCRNWYSNAPVCAPARAALLTGRCPLRAGVPNNGMPLRPSEITLASALRGAGYTTGLTGKWHLGSTPETVPNAHGFDYFYGFHEGCVDYFSHRFYWGEPKIANFHDLWRNRDEIFEDGQYLTERIGQEASSFISRTPPGRPFFLYTALNAVHYPMHAPAKYVNQFSNLERERQMYAAMLSAADDAIGEILAALDRTSRRNQTLIFILGDNGATTERRAGLSNQPATAGRNTPFRGFKFSTFDGGMHVPALVNWPGHIPGSQTNTQILMTADIFPTVCRIAGVPIPPDRTLDGRDIWPVLTAGANSPHDYVAWSEGPQLAIRQGPWKLVLNGVTHDGTPEGSKPLTGDDAAFLSNVVEDPGESRNLRHQYPAVADQLQSLLQKWRQSVEAN
ncbi:MAG: sulfatase-like hydrolase/transferase [Acidobacteriaceae bacterium]|nr:sulfatase-like hydrolase/transferase [Acidobacteriaceae bacterium]